MADTSRFNAVVGSEAQAGFVGLTKEFEYLGLIASADITSGADVDKRIKSASAAPSALKWALTISHLDHKAKGRIYVALVMAILLYCCEVWSLREGLFHRLRRFHNRCCRTICRIAMA